MISLDTNILLRILVDDPKNIAQNQLARSLVSKHKQLFISQIVQIELYWILVKSYKFNKDSIIQALAELLINKVFVLENHKNFAQALHQYKSHELDFPELLILANSKQAAAKYVITLNKKFASLAGVKLAE